MAIMNQDGIDQVKASLEYIKSGSLTLNEIIKRELISALNRTSGNRTYAAQQLGVSLRTVRNWIRKYELPPKSKPEAY